MYVKNEGGRGSVLNLTNLGLRVLQMLFGATVLGLYASQYSYKKWEERFPPVWQKLPLGVAAGAMGLITAPILAVLPFFFGYVVVMWCFVWDFIMMCVYAATFAYFKDKLRPYTDAGLVRTVLSKEGISKDHTNLMQGAVSVVLVGMLLWLISLLMALVMIVYSFFRRR